MLNKPKTSPALAALLALPACCLIDSLCPADTILLQPGQPAKSRAVVVCRAKQCAPAKLSMSREYIANSLIHLFGNNTHKTALVCEADPNARVCTESFVTVPATVGITPAGVYIDSVKISDSSYDKKTGYLKLLLDYNITYNGQKADCLPSQTIAFVKDADSIVLEDGGYSCKMTAIGQTSVKTFFAVDYIDLDYGFIGGYYSIGASGPAYGGGTGYMMIRLPSDAYPLAPALQTPSAKKKKTISSRIVPLEDGTYVVEEKTAGSDLENNNVQVFPIKKDQKE